MFVLPSIQVWVTLHLVKKGWYIALAVWGRNTIYILYSSLYSHINYICIVDSNNNGHMIHQILIALMFRFSFMEMWAWGICFIHPKNKKPFQKRFASLAARAILVSLFSPWYTCVFCRNWSSNDAQSWRHFACSFKWGCVSYSFNLKIYAT